ncbi:armadillo-type protein [Mucor mucedo]|uniref:armadillo-type protein n=1 Tax=Mucor mucedo TaxID=29922 RepID=UPI00221F580A|nr:armadillo-type protein [Mucor mucedo]KAI7893280.1 armadillo-type protein [Mucor mucedo]
MTLSPLERLEKFSISKMVLQRLVVTRELSNTIHSISLTDAVDKALPIIIELGKDTDDSVREALAGELDKVIYFYYQNAPPLLSDDKETQQPHIPANAFASTVIDFLLDQNTTLASIAQQSIVTVAAELADTPKSSEQYEFNQSLLNNEIFQGIILGLISIVNSGNQQEDLEEEKEMDMATVVEKGTANVMDSFSTAIVEKVPLDKTPENKVISSATNAVLKHYDDGGINLAKMVCLMLISALAQVFGPEGCTDKFLPIVESMVSDPMFYVRKEAAAAVGSLSTSVDPKTALDRLLPLYLKLSVDTIWHVRRACVFALPFLCEVLPNEVKTTIAVNGVELFKNDVSRNVRNSLADITGEMISKFLPDDWKETGNPGKVPEELLDFFLSLGNTTTSANQMFKTDTERIHNCAYNYPAVVLTAGVEYWDTHLKDTYLNLTKDYQLKVRRTFAYSLHDIARIIGPERTERDLVQIFALYLMDLDDVKQGVLEHLSEFLGVLAITSRNEYIPILAEVWDGVMSNWHLRDILANQLRDISRLFDASRVVEHILPLAIRACHDEFAAVRETAVEIFPVILDIVKRTVDDDGENLSQIEESENDTDNMADRQQKYALALLNHVMEKIDDLVRSSAHRTRLVFTQICRSLLDAGINPADFGSFFLPRLVGLAKDKVVNVRIATSRTIKTLCSIAGYRHDLETITFIEGATTENDMTPGQVLDDILYLLSTDKDRDVRYYVEEFITPECLLAYQEKKVMQDSIIAKELAIKQSEKIFPPTLPAHLIMIHSPALSNLDDEEEEEYESDHDIHNTTELPVVFEEDEESEEIYHSTESPMDIVDDYDDVEDMSLSGNMGTSLYEECIKDEDQVIPFTDIHTSSTLDEEDDIMMESPSDNHEEVAEKAQHVYLSKIPAHVVLNSSVPPAVPADNN